MCVLYVGLAPRLSPPPHTLVNGYCEIHNFRVFLGIGIFSLDADDQYIVCVRKRHQIYQSIE